MESRPGGFGPQAQDRHILQQQEYVDDRNLDVRRRTHQLYTLDPVDFGRWTLEQLAWRGGERVLDVGCGPGDLLHEMARRRAGWGCLIGFDFSAGMVLPAAAAAAGLPVHFFVGDAQAAPLPAAAFDVVLARHMLYHVPDMERALAEIARLLRPGGHLLVTTNSQHSMPEYQELRRRAAARFPVMVEPELITDRFSLENGPAILAGRFERVETRLLRGTLRFPAAQPFVDYFASSRAMTMRPDHTEAEWSAILDFVRAEGEAIVARQGYLDVTKITGAIVGVRGG